MIWIVGLLVIVVALVAAGTLATWHAVRTLRDTLQSQDEARALAAQGRRTEREEVLQFVRDRVTERVQDFTAGGGRERLRQRLQARMGESHQHSGREDGAQGADGPRTEMTHG